MRRIIFNLFVAAFHATAFAGELAFERVVIDANFPGAYQVEVADVNGDGRPDIVAIGGNTCAWYENPKWTKRVVSGPDAAPGVISSATADIDGDGKAEIALAHEFSMNQPTKGKLSLARQGATPDAPWTVIPVADFGSIHRLRWGDVNGDGKLDLIVAPIFGKEATPPAFQEGPARVVAYETGGLAEPGRWSKRDVTEARVLHAIDVIDLDGNGRSDVLGASNLGVTRSFLPADGAGFVTRTIGVGASGTPPKVGSSEVHVGKLRDGRRFLVTVDPWHGTDVAVRISEGKGLDFGPRVVIDSTLRDGHALWVADVDGDGDDEVFAGFRGTGTSVLAFDPNADATAWARTVVDAAIAAQDLRGGDLDGDGVPDIVAVGGATINVVWYRPRR